MSEEPRIVRVLNVILAPFGRRIYEVHASRFYRKPNGGIGRLSIPTGRFRLSTREDADLPDTASEIERFQARRKGKHDG